MGKYKESVAVLDEILEEIAKHPLLSVTRAVSRGAVKDGRTQMGAATVVYARTEIERRIHASRALDSVVTLREALGDIAELAAKDSPIHETVKKAERADAKLTEDIDEAQEWLSGFSDDTVMDAFVEVFVDNNGAMLAHVDTSSNLFSEFVSALTDDAIDAGLFDDCDPALVYTEMGEALVEFLPALARAGAALARGAKSAARTAAKTGRSFVHGVRKGYRATSQKHLGQRTKALAKKVGHAALRKAARYAVNKLKKYAGDDEPKKTAPAAKPKSKPKAASKPKPKTKLAPNPQSKPKTAAKPKTAPKPAAKPSAPKAKPGIPAKGRRARKTAPVAA